MATVLTLAQMHHVSAWPYLKKERDGKCGQGYGEVSDRSFVLGNQRLDANRLSIEPNLKIGARIQDGVHGK